MTDHGRGQEPVPLWDPKARLYLGTLGRHHKKSHIARPQPLGVGRQEQILRGKLAVDGRGRRLGVAGDPTRAGAP
jgi:hypothetical protein